MKSFHNRTVSLFKNESQKVFLKGELGLLKEGQRIIDFSKEASRSFWEASVGLHITGHMSLKEDPLIF